MKRRREIWKVTLSGFLAGVIYTLLADDLSDPAPVLNALLIGTIGGFFAGVIELYIFQPQHQRPEFAKSVFLKVITYFFMLLFLVLIVKGSIDSYFRNITFSEYYSNQEFQDFILYGEFRIIMLYSFAMIFLIIFTLQVSKFLGPGVLWNYITGHYHRPRYENRIILLIDINNSTMIAEKLDPVMYYMLLDRFFFDVNAGASRHGGAIYRYIGDQVTITWPMRSRERNADCIRAFFEIKHQIHLQKKVYLNQFGFVPGFKGTAHGGQMVSGEIGDIRSQIVYYGLPLLQAARLEKLSGRSQNGLCISGDLLGEIVLPSNYFVHQAGQLTSKGKELAAYEVTEELITTPQ